MRAGELYNVHSLVDFVNVEVAVDGLHSVIGVAHGVESLFVNVCCFYRVDFSLDG